MDATLATLADQAAAGTGYASTRTAAAQARIVDLDKKIAQYRASLDAGGDPVVIGPWIAETQAQKVAAQAEIRSATGQHRMTRDEIAAILTTLGDLVQVIRDPGMIGYTLPEIRRLLISLIQGCAPGPEGAWSWSRWRRRRQYQARLCHYRHRGYLLA
jgi:hypothetical protein